jgi:hypothetical protein
MAPTCLVHGVYVKTSFLGHLLESKGRIVSQYLLRLSPDHRSLFLDRLSQIKDDGSMSRSSSTHKMAPIGHQKIRGDSYAVEAGSPPTQRGKWLLCLHEGWNGLGAGGPKPIYREYREHRTVNCRPNIIYFSGTMFFLLKGMLFHKKLPKFFFPFNPAANFNYLTLFYSPYL